jgi:Protein of unknown function (DUF4079)
MSQDLILLLHPIAAIVVVFPLLGIVLNRAVQTRQRRLQTAGQSKSKIPPTVGQEHVLGRWLIGAVVGVLLLALTNDVVGNILENQLVSKAPFKVAVVSLFFVATIASLVLLYRANQPFWRGAFATLTGIGLVVLGFQDGVYQNTENWYKSHFYYGIAAALLMIFALAILPEIYRDRSNRWRKVHIALNCIALLLFIGQGITGAQTLLEVPLHWQKPYIQQLYEHQCDQKPCAVQAPPK